MGDGWLDSNKYEHVPITAATGPGTMYDGYAWKWINHSTEGGAGSINGVISLFRAQPASCPHFILDPMGTRRRVQCIPWKWSAAALRGGSGGWQTNRGRAVQVEICGFARDAASWPEEALWQVADLIADVIKDGCPIDPTNTPDSTSLRGTLATMTAPQRMSWATWQRFPGLAAHVYVPNNDHWDVGNLNNVRLGQMVVQILGGSARFVPPTPDAGGGSGDDTRVGYITEGMAGGQVTLIQELLQGLGYDVGALDGDFGPATKAAVEAFQRDHDLDADGIVGPVTKAKLDQLYAEVSGKPKVPTPGTGGGPAFPGRFLVLTGPLMNGGDVQTWQARMAERGWRVDVDGWYGTESYGVCKSFQHEFGLTEDGIVGPQSWDAAWSAPVQ